MILDRMLLLNTPPYKVSFHSSDPEPETMLDNNSPASDPAAGQPSQQTMAGHLAQVSQ